MLLALDVLQILTKLLVLLKQGFCIQLRLWKLLFVAQKGNHIP